MKRISNASQYWTTAATCRASHYIYRVMHWRFHGLNCKSPQQMMQLLAALTDPEHAAASAGQPYVGVTLSMYPPPGEQHMGNFIAWDARAGKIVWSKREQFSVWSGALATAGNVVFYGTLEGYLKAVDAKTGNELFKFKTPSGIIGNLTAYEHNGKQYIAVLSGVGGWAGIGLAAGLTEPTAGLGAVGGYAALHDFTSLGGQLTVFSLAGN
jgi:glucose dehydrogenase